MALRSDAIDTPARPLDRLARRHRPPQHISEVLGLGLDELLLLDRRQDVQEGHGGAVVFQQIHDDGLYGGSTGL